jgi:hypothetical protein
VIIWVEDTSATYSSTGKPLSGPTYAATIVSLKATPLRNVHLCLEAPLRNVQISGDCSEMGWGFLSEIFLMTPLRNVLSRHFLQISDVLGLLSEIFLSDVSSKKCSCLEMSLRNVLISGDSSQQFFIKISDIRGLLTLIANVCHSEIHATCFD